MSAVLYFLVAHTQGLQELKIVIDQPIKTRPVRSKENTGPEEGWWRWERRRNVRVGGEMGEDGSSQQRQRNQ